MLSHSLDARSHHGYEYCAMLARLEIEQQYIYDQGIDKTLPTT